MKKLLLGAVLMLASFVASAASVSITPAVGTPTQESAYIPGAYETNVVGMSSPQAIFDVSLSGADLGLATFNLTSSLSDWSYSVFQEDISGTLLVQGGDFIANNVQSFQLLMSSAVSVYKIVISGDTQLNGFLTSFILPVEVSEVPLPAAVWLFGSVLLGGLALRRRNKKATMQAVAA